MFQECISGQGIITYNRDWWEGAGGEVICFKRVQQSFLNQRLDPPNQKFLDPPVAELSAAQL